MAQNVSRIIMTIIAVVFFIVLFRAMILYFKCDGRGVWGGFLSGNCEDMSKKEKQNGGKKKNKQKKRKSKKY
jgi:hypothetical protein